MKHSITLIIALLLAQRATLHAADPFDRATIVGLMRQANDWQTAHPRMKPDDRNWERGTWFTGIMAAYKATGDEEYLTQTHEYVTGAFLLAGSEMLTLLSPRAKPDPLAESFSSPPDCAARGLLVFHGRQPVPRGDDGRPRIDAPGGPAQGAFS